jgi:DGQHR domain-containing protein
MSGFRVLERKALMVKQPSGRSLYLFSLSGEDLLQVAEISRLGRSDDGKLIGYQRPEVKRHVKEIADYFSSEEMLLAHPLVLAFDSRVRFLRSRGPFNSDGLGTNGSLRIPVNMHPGPKTGWIVDGQQRALAVSRCKRRDFAVPVCAFIADEVELQRDQFLRINNTRPLPRGLVTELLPTVSSSLPPKLALYKIPSALCDLLNQDQRSPFYGLIRRASNAATSKGQSIVADTVVTKMLCESLTNPSGCLFPYRNVATSECDHDSIWTILLTYWNAVRQAFPSAWGKPPIQSRLMHGVGLRAMGRLMDRIMSTVNVHDKDALRAVQKAVLNIAPHCHWTSGRWDELGGIAWNDLENIHKHHQLLSSHLVRMYLEQQHA